MKGKKLASVLLCLTLVFVTVFSGTGSAFANTPDPDSVESDPIAATVMQYSNTAEPQYRQYATIAGGLISIIPVTASATGWMYIDASAAADNDYGAKIYLVEQYGYDSTTGMISIAETKLNSYWYLNPGETKEDIQKHYVEEGETYYILFQSADYSQVNPVASFRARIYTTGQGNVAASTSKWTVSSSMNAEGESGQANWFKVKPSKNGLMRVYLKEFGAENTYGYVTLCNAKKKAVSDKVRYSSASGKGLYFGVKKNQTYYLKVEGCYGSYNEAYTYGVRYTMTGLTDKAYPTKAKAKTLKRKGTAATNLFTASTASATDWYKFNVGAKRTTHIKINTSWIKSGHVTVTIYKGKSKIGSTRINGGSNGGTYEVTYGNTYGKATKGTYYVKVVKSPKASGKYTIKYVK